jgi:hypothetical protein
MLARSEERGQLDQRRCPMVHELAQKWPAFLLRKPKCTRTRFVVNQK